jgi:CheY-like chemotaxis protein
VLAIDNEPRVLDGMRVLLQKWGCRVATADGLAGALASLAVRPDVIIADFHLDDCDGLAVIAALRERLGYLAPAILATADRSAEVRDAAAAAEVALLNKPLKPAPLRAQLSRCLALRAAE